MKRTRSDVVFDAVNIAFMALILIIAVYPLYFVIVASFSDPYAVSRGEVQFFVKGFTLDSYKFMLGHEEIWTGYGNTLFYTLAGTVFNLLLTIPPAYALSKRGLPGKSALSWFFLFTMYFGGGLIPTYLLVRNLGLLNNPMTLVILGGLSVYNMIVARIYFQTSIPDELYEAARIDGASDFRQFFQLALPLAAPIIAVVTLYYGVGRWNDFFTALIYISNPKFYPLQMILRNILIENQNALTAIMSESQKLVDEEYVAFIMRRAYIAESMKYALIIVASAPLLIAYPFVQKYFVKGIMIGSLKG